LKELAGAIQKRLKTVKAQVAHLKMTLSPDASLTGDIAAVTWFGMTSCRSFPFIWKSQ